MFENKEIFGERLKEEMDARNISADFLSQKINVPTKAVYNWCASVSQPKLSGLIKLANYFNYSIDYMLDKEFTKYDSILFNTCPPFSMQLKKYMSAKNIKPMALSRAIDIDRKQIYRWLKDEAEPQLESIVRLADYFKTTIDILIGRQ